MKGVPKGGNTMRGVGHIQLGECTNHNGPKPGGSASPARPSRENLWRRSAVYPPLQHVYGTRRRRVRYSARDPRRIRLARRMSSRAHRSREERASRSIVLAIPCSKNRVKSEVFVPPRKRIAKDEDATHSVVCPPNQRPACLNLKRLSRTGCPSGPGTYN